ncbi:MAG: hypothetical protein LCH37_06630 [Bacteroidetes bacterium]|nr:hypothetical protein [Bacteroidota bacterium]
MKFRLFLFFLLGSIGLLKAGNVEDFQKLHTEESMLDFFKAERIRALLPNEMDQLKTLCAESGYEKVEVYWYYIDFLFSEVLKRNDAQVLNSINQMIFLAKKYKLPAELCVGRFRKTLLDFSAHRINEKQAYYEYLNTFEELKQLGIEPLKRFGPDWILNELGRNFYEVSDYEKAIETLELAKRYENEGSIFKILSLNLLESSYAKLGNYDSAFSCAERIYAVSSGKINRINYDSWTQQFWQSLSQLHMAEYSIQQSDKENAQLHLKLGYEKIPICSNYSLNHQVLAEYEAVNEVARMNMILGNYEPIEQLLNRAKFLLNHLKVEMEVHAFKPLMLYQNYVKWYRYNKEYEKAFYFLEHADSIQEKLNKRNDKRQLWQTEMRVKSERYKTEIRKIEEAQEIEKWIRNAALALLFIGIIIGYTIYKRISKDNSIILNQKISLETSLAEKETLLKEVHHRVKNNFQIITGLLEKQASKTSDPKAQSLFREGQDRIISMALVHQNIYQSSNLTSIGLKNYIELLSLQIRQSFNHKTGIDIETEIDSIEVNIDKAIPIGLILNECITNCFKHAFPNQINGKIQVILTQSQSGFQLEINDNGIGLNSIEQTPTKTNIGISLLKGLSRQLDARFEFGNLPQQGSFFRFFIKN